MAFLNFGFARFVDLPLVRELDYVVSGSVHGSSLPGQARSEPKIRLDINRGT